MFPMEEEGYERHTETTTDTEKGGNECIEQPPRQHGITEHVCWKSTEDMTPKGEGGCTISIMTY